MSNDLWSVVTDISKLPVDEQGGVMARKDLEKETERPRYYSQFWLDVAAGRRVIGVGKGAEAGEDGEGEEESAPELSTKAGKAPKGTALPPVVEAEPSGRRTQNQPLRLSGTESLADLAAAAGLVDLESDVDSSSLEEKDVSRDVEPLPEAQQTALEEEPVEETYSFTNLYDEEEEEEEEEEEGGWPSSRRGKKQQQQQQHKKQEKPRRREKGRDF